MGLSLCSSFLQFRLIGQKARMLAHSVHLIILLKVELHSCIRHCLSELQYQSYAEMDRGKDRRNPFYGHIFRLINIAVNVF